MPKRIVGWICLIAGIALVLAGVAWQFIFPAQSYWSPSQAQEYTDASTALKMAVSRPGRRADDKPDPQLIAAQERFDTIKGQLDRAIVVRDRGGMVAGATGIVLACLGGWLISSSPGESEATKLPQKRAVRR